MAATSAIVPFNSDPLRYIKEERERSRKEREKGTSILLMPISILENGISSKYGEKIKTDGASLIAIITGVLPKNEKNEWTQTFKVLLSRNINDPSPISLPVYVSQGKGNEPLLLDETYSVDKGVEILMSGPIDQVKGLEFSNIVNLIGVTASKSETKVVDEQGEKVSTKYFVRAAKVAVLSDCCSDVLYREMKSIPRSRLSRCTEVVIPDPYNPKAARYQRMEELLIIHKDAIDRINLTDATKTTAIDHFTIDPDEKAWILTNQQGKKTIRLQGRMTRLQWEEGATYDKAKQKETIGCTFNLWESTLKPFLIRDPICWYSIAPAIMPYLSFTEVAQVSIDQTNRMDLNLVDDNVGGGAEGEVKYDFGIDLAIPGVFFDAPMSYEDIGIPVTKEFAFELVRMPNNKSDWAKVTENEQKVVFKPATTKILCLNELGEGSLRDLEVKISNYETTHPGSVVYRVLTPAGLTEEVLDNIRKLTPTEGNLLLKATWDNAAKRERTSLPSDHPLKQIPLVAQGILWKYVFVIFKKNIDVGANAVKDWFRGSLSNKRTVSSITDGEKDAFTSVLMNGVDHNEDSNNNNNNNTTTTDPSGTNKTSGKVGDDVAVDEDFGSDSEELSKKSKKGKKHHHKDKSKK